MPALRRRSAIGLTLALGLLAGLAASGGCGGGVDEALLDPESPLEGIDRLTPATRARLQQILVPQPTPEDCIDLQLELMHRGIYYRDVPMYDAAWRRARLRDPPSDRVKAMAREQDGPFAVKRLGDHAISYFRGTKAEVEGPHFLRRTADGWIIDASSVMKHIIYDPSNRWYALDGDYPYLPILKSVYDMRRVTSRSHGAAWKIATSP